MQRPITPENLQILLREADAAARRLQRRFRLNREDLEDARQDLLADAIARLPGYEAGRGTLGAFAGTVMANRATRLAQHIIRHRRMFGAVPVSLDEWMPDCGGATRGDLISEEQALAAVQGYWANPITDLERRIDIERGLGLLDAAARRLAAGLAGNTAHQLAKDGKGSRSELYRQARHLRLTLMAVGIQAA